MEKLIGENKKLKEDFSLIELTSLVHYYRGEMSRMNTWRTRLDVTTNWAIITTAAFLSFSFGDTSSPHFVLILATIFVFCFLFIEARRYKYYDLWRWRIALMNENFFAVMLTPDIPPLNSDWRELLSQELQHSKFKISFWEAFGRRLRRNYSWIFIILAICWMTKVAIHPEPIEDFSIFLKRASIYHLMPGWIVFAAGVLFNGALLLIALTTMKTRNEAVKIEPYEKSKIRLPNI
jgi:uncharacterized membrane protein